MHSLSELSAKLQRNRRDNKLSLLKSPNNDHIPVEEHTLSCHSTANRRELESDTGLKRMKETQEPQKGLISLWFAKKSLVEIGKRVIAASQYYYIIPCHEKEPARIVFIFRSIKVYWLCSVNGF